MLTSERSRLVRGTLIAGAAAAALSLVLSPAEPAMTSLPVHPAWLIGLILAARYGVRGLFAIPAIVAGVSFAELMSGSTELAMVARLGNVGDLAVLMVASLISGVGATHEGRKSQLEARLRAAESRAAKAEAAVDDLAEAAIALRDRCDRSQTSLAFLADVAVRIDDPDPNGAGQAALELAIARTGARSGFVQLLEGGRLSTLTSRGAWSADQMTPPSVFRDLVAAAALDRAKPVAAHEVSNVRTEDSDLAAPLIGEDGVAVGVLALRGIAHRSLTSAAREDLAAVARWAARSLAKPSRDAGPAARGLRAATAPIAPHLTPANQNASGLSPSASRALAREAGRGREADASEPEARGRGENAGGLGRAAT